MLTFEDPGSSVIHYNSLKLSEIIHCRNGGYGRGETKVDIGTILENNSSCSKDISL